MKRIEFIAPVEAMRGNISGSQVLTYDGGKKAFDVGGSGVAAAENYSKKYIGAKRSSNGKKYFSLKAKSQTNLGASSRLAMAAFGGACSLALAATSTLSILSQLQSIHETEIAEGLTERGSLRNWVQKKVYPMLKNKQNSVTITDGTSTVTINNPWKTGGTGTDVDVPDYIQSKFNSYLS